MVGGRRFVLPPVRLQFGRLTANDHSGKTVSGAMQEPEPGKETRNGAGTSEVKTQRIAQGPAAGVEGGRATGNQTVAHQTGGENRPGPPNRPNGMAMKKFKAPSALSGKQGEDAADWMEIYETTAEYNRWGETEKRANFGMYSDDPAQKWFQYLNPPALCVDTTAVPAGGGTAGTAAVDG